MQDEINEKVVALSVKGAKLTAETLQKAIKAMLAQAKKQQEKQLHGKQTLKQLAKQNAGLSNIEITEGNIKAFEQTAKKYGIDFALKKDSTETPPRYLVFFKGRDADALTAAFKEFSAKKLNKEQKPSKLLCFFMENPDQVLSAEQILGKLWDCNENYIDNNSLTVYIRRLRTKIEDNPGEPKRIVTVRGMGYKWNTVD